MPETETAQTQQAQPQQVTVVAEKPPIFGIISTILGGASLLPLLGILSPLGLLLGVVGFYKDARITVPLIGTVLSILGIITSPVIWAMLMPPDRHATPMEVGAYWGTVTFIGVAGVGLLALFFKDRLGKK